MDTLIVTPKNKNSIPFLKHLLSTLSDVEKVEVVDNNEYKIEKSIEAGLRDLEGIILGNIQGKPLNQLLNED